MPSELNLLPSDGEGREGPNAPRTGGHRSVPHSRRNADNAEIAETEPHAWPGFALALRQGGKAELAQCACFDNSASRLGQEAASCASVPRPIRRAMSVAIYVRFPCPNRTIEATGIDVARLDVARHG